MSKDPKDPPTPQDQQTIDLAKELDRQGRYLTLNAVDQAYLAGQIFNRMQEEQLYLALGYRSHHDYLQSVEKKGRKATTILAYQQITRVLTLDQVAHVGVGKARLLSQDYVPDPARILERGLEVPDGKGGTVVKPIGEMNYRNLNAALRRLYKPRTARSRKKAAAAGAHPGEAHREEGRTPEPVTPVNATPGSADAPDGHGVAAAAGQAPDGPAGGKSGAPRARQPKKHKDAPAPEPQATGPVTASEVRGEPEEASMADQSSPVPPLDLKSPAGTLARNLDPNASSSIAAPGTEGSRGKGELSEVFEPDHAHGQHAEGPGSPDVERSPVDDGQFLEDQGYPEDEDARVLFAAAMAQASP